MELAVSLSVQRTQLHVKCPQLCMNFEARAVCGYACSNWLVGGSLCGHGELCHVDECGLHRTDWKADLHQAFCTLFPVQRSIVDFCNESDRYVEFFSI